MKAFKAHDYLGLTKERKRKKSKKKHVRSYCEKDTGGGCMQPERNSAVLQPEREAKGGKKYVYKQWRKEEVSVIYGRKKEGCEGGP